MTRQRLPHRRCQTTLDIEWAGRTWSLSVGFDGEGRARELFLFSTLGGSDLEALVDDACVAISLLLQHGLSITELAKHLGRQGVDPQSPAASLLGLATARAAEIEAEEQDARREPTQPAENGDG